MKALTMAPPAIYAVYDVLRIGAVVQGREARAGVSQASAVPK